MANDLTFTTFPFEPGEPIPDEFTCEGADVSPPLEWAHVPEGTQTLALIVDDPDAPGRTFVHWVLYNIPAGRTRLPRDLDLDAHFAGSEVQPMEGVNGFGNLGYGGPCPPPGDSPHRYFFRLYALDTVLNLGEGATREQVTDAMNGHILDETDLIGTYQRG